MKLRIATWNVERPGAHAERNIIINRQISEIGADIWILTETNDAITPGDGYEQVASTPRPWHKPGEHSTTIWSRFPINQRITPFSGSDRFSKEEQGYYVSGPDDTLAVCVEVKAPSVVLLVYGTIITWRDDPGPAGIAEPWEEYSRSIDAHRADWKHLRARFHNMCIAGDFNTGFEGKWRYGTPGGRERLRDTFSTCNLTCPTCALPHVANHICMSDTLIERATSVNAGFWAPEKLNNRPVSDHHGVYIDLPFP